MAGRIIPAPNWESRNKALIPPVSLLLTVTPGNACQPCTRQEIELCSQSPAAREQWVEFPLSVQRGLFVTTEIKAHSREKGFIGRHVAHGAAQDRLHRKSILGAVTPAAIKRKFSWEDENKLNLAEQKWLEGTTDPILETKPFSTSEAFGFSSLSLSVHTAPAAISPFSMEYGGQQPTQYKAKNWRESPVSSSSEEVRPCTYCEIKVVEVSAKQLGLGIMCLH